MLGHIFNDNFSLLRDTISLAPLTDAVLLYRGTTTLSAYNCPLQPESIPQVVYK